MPALYWLHIAHSLSNKKPTSLTNMLQPLGEKHEHDLHMELYGIRTLLFMETEPQSNKYRQVELTAEEFKNVNMSYGKNTGAIIREGVNEVELHLSEEIYDLPDLPEIYE